MSSFAKLEGESDRWIKSFEDVVRNLYRRHSVRSGVQRVRIAILDTGIDRTHHTVRGYSTRVRRVCDFLDNASGDDEDDRSGDADGHGTRIACMVLKWAPSAEISVGRIAKQMNELNEDNAHNVAKGIRAARTRWDVDIIVMSFGFNEVKREMDRELDEALRSDILVFAAASNDGPLRTPPYPAWKGQVFCIHSTDGLGNWSRTNPDPLKDSCNFAFLGEHIEASWCSTGPPATVKRVSGSSYATAIAAAVAASLLDWAKSEEQLRDTPTRIRSFDGMEFVLRRMSVKLKESCYSISLKELFHGDLTFASSEVARVLTRRRH